MMEPKLNLWFEVDDQVALSLWRVQLLQAIAAEGSISGGAAVMSVPYRVAWQKVHEMENLLDQKLIETQIGGRQGGGATLTPLALDFVSRFQQFQKRVQPLLTETYQELFADLVA